MAESAQKFKEELEKFAYVRQHEHTQTNFIVTQV
jgi:hypothetical protein